MKAQEVHRRRLTDQIQLITHHLAASLKPYQTALGAPSAAKIAFFLGGRLIHCHCKQPDRCRCRDGHLTIGKFAWPSFALSLPASKFRA
jgi:hypothetical protein